MKGGGGEKNQAELQFKRDRDLCPELTKPWGWEINLPNLCLVWKDT